VVCSAAPARVHAARTLRPCFGGGAVFDIYQNQPVGPALGNGLTETRVQAGTYYIDVYAGASGTFTLTLTG
jgi:hypothetical protein